MEIYNNEDEQVDAVRNFFRENGKAIVLGIILGAGGLFGWRFWQSHQHQSVTSASMTFDRAIMQSGNTARLQSFIEENDSTYGVFAAMKLAQQWVEKGDIDKAKQQLVWAQGHTKDVNLLAAVNLRLARVHLNDKQFDDALKTLEAIPKGGWFAQAQSIRGDILVQKGENSAARDAYGQALEANPSPVLQELLRIKLNNLAA